MAPLRKAPKNVALVQADNPFLNQSKVTKKEKRQNKHNLLHDRLASDRVSKSAAKREKRKAKQNLATKLNELLDVLPKELSDNTSSSDGYIARKSKPIDANKNAKNNDKVVKEEITRFNQVVGEDSFKKSPFSALRQFITSNIEQKDDFIKLQAKRDNAMQS